MCFRVCFSSNSDSGMASPQSERAGVTFSSGKGLSLTPGSRVLQTPLADDAIWKRLKEAGFDEESIKRRDKAALIAYIAKLEAEVCLISYITALSVLEIHISFTHSSLACSSRDAGYLESYFCFGHGMGFECFLNTKCFCI